MKNSGIDKKELERRKKSMKSLRYAMGFVDFFAIILLIVQIKIAKNVSYISYVLLVLCNIITFTLEPGKYYRKNRKK